MIFACKFEGHAMTQLASALYFEIARTFLADHS